ncbi:MAG TPA: terminase family protein [Anaeromyxobacteraceae bacterium]|nr:terminase family protein [Anaeromyxobacteraceae bacterium]
MVSREEARAELWRRGSLRWKLYQDQREVYDVVRSFLDNQATQYEQFWLDVSRQWGKTFLGVLLADECARRNPGWAIRYVSYSRRGLQDFVLPNFAALLADCPKPLRPDFKYVEAAFVYSNGSRISLSGANNGHEDDARGPRAHLIINEECGFLDRMDYLVKSVELPQLTTTGGRILHITTPPETPAHESSAFKAECKAKGNYVRRTIDDNRHISDRAREKIIEEMGGRESTKAGRELFCEDVVDSDRAIVPEYTAKVDDQAVKPIPAIGWHWPLVAMDVGFEDLHAILYGYWDFARAKLCVQAEDILHRSTTQAVAGAVRNTEERLWSTAHRPHPIRWSDTDPRLIADLAADHALEFIATGKDELEAQVNALRLLVKSGKLEIDPSCKVLRNTLMVGVWNKSRTQFDRLPGVGHSDAVAALIYMLRNANRYDNPYPALAEGITPASHQIPLRVLGKKSVQAEALATVFAQRRR